MLKSMKKVYIGDIKNDSNVLTNTYGRNNYDSWMANHQKNGNIVYDTDRGFINEKNLMLSQGYNCQATTSSFLMIIYHKLAEMSKIICIYNINMKKF